MESTTWSQSAPVPSERVACGRIWPVGLLAVLLAVVANLLVRTIGVALFNVSNEFLALTVGPTIMFTVVGVLGAVVVFAIIARVATRPIRLFRRIAGITLLVSLLPDLAMLIAPAFPGTTPATVGVLMVEHIVAALISVGLLTTLTRQPAR